ncbi:MAG: PQQ-binding-like beta-propeller repeat protein [Deltaproteobacteria bacterium]|nr:PQQ-binding-like beta-propeller repeat protein [Deltaproteobacteria bacterium]
MTGSSDGYLYALDARDGSVLWRYYPGYGLSGDFAYADHRVYFLGNGGQLFALRPSLFLHDPLVLKIRFRGLCPAIVGSCPCMNSNVYWWA